LFISGQAGKQFIDPNRLGRRPDFMSDPQTVQPAPRMLSLLPPTNHVFWTSGKEGQLRLLRSRSSGRWIHPFWNVAEDDSDLTPEAVSGKGRVFTFTVNLHSYNPQVPPPYIIAIVQLPEQDDLRIATNIVNCEPDEVEIGAPVRVLFEPHGDIFVPLFELDR
jgi:uncharacterized OB-fold protein